MNGRWRDVVLLERRSLTTGASQLPPMVRTDRDSYPQSQSRVMFDFFLS